MARRELVPIMRERLASLNAPGSSEGVELHLDLLQWLLANNATLPQPRSLENLAELALVAFVGSTHTAATTLTNVLLDLAARPADLEVVRKEVSQMNLKATGLNLKQSFYINQTSKLDSFMKESQRLNPAFLTVL